MRFLQFAGSKATEYELMECCIVAHLTHVHQWGFLRIHGISRYRSTSEFSLSTHRYVRLSHLNFACLILSIRRGADPLSLVVPLKEEKSRFPDKTTTFNTVRSAFHAAFSSRRMKTKKKRWDGKKNLGVPLSEWKRNDCRERSGKIRKTTWKAEKGVLKDCRTWYMRVL